MGQADGLGEKFFTADFGLSQAENLSLLSSHKIGILYKLFYYTSFKESGGFTKNILEMVLGQNFIILQYN